MKLGFSAGKDCGFIGFNQEGSLINGGKSWMFVFLAVSKVHVYTGFGGNFLPSERV